MENLTNDNREWVDRRMALLDPVEGLTPNAVRAFARLQERGRRFRVVRRNWVWGSAVASLAVLTLAAIPTRSICCVRPTPEAQAPAVERITPADPNPVPVLLAAPKPAQARPNAPVRVNVADASIRVYAASYKHTGSPSAPLLIEIYSDFECPACAAFYRDTWPLLVSQYVDTGKARIVHRDFPLPQHAFAKLAARYANAAGELGQYDLAFNRLFETQSEWSGNGNIDAALAPVFAPGLMASIREMVSANDPKLDETIRTDQGMGASGHLTRTPALIVIANGESHKLDGAPPFKILSAYLNQLTQTSR
jgi:protein-disulfide isomerase